MTTPPARADWGSAGLPLEGTGGSETRVGAHPRRDVPSCGLDEQLADVRARVSAAGWDTCFVVTAEHVVLGRLGRGALARKDDATVEDAMTPGPSTVRPSLELEQAVERMRRQDLTTLPVTTSDGRLFGLLEREAAEYALHELGG